MESRDNPILEMQEMEKLNPSRYSGKTGCEQGREAVQHGVLLGVGGSKEMTWNFYPPPMIIRPRVCSRAAVPAPGGPRAERPAATPRESATLSAAEGRQRALQPPNLPSSKALWPPCDGIVGIPLVSFWRVPAQSP